MKVSDVMAKHVDYVSTSVTVKEICRLIFGAGINGVPVCENRKVIGFITDADILSKFHPTMQEFIEDPFSSSNFERMEEKIQEIFDLTAKDVMSKRSVTIDADAPLMHADSIMSVKNVGRLPVLDKRGNLIGIISRGDIFRVAVGDKLPITGDEEYHDWLSKHYDLIVKWGERLGNEVPDLTSLFTKEGVKNVLDIGCGTGEHDIALARNGFNVIGMERSSLMHESSREKLMKLPKDISQKLEFLRGDYVKMLEEGNKNFEAAIFMGNAFSHLSDIYKEVLQAVAKVLSKKNALIVFQLINYEKVFKIKNRFLDLSFGKSKLGIFREHAFLEFYDPPKRKGDNLTLNMSVLDFSGKKWKHRATNSTPIVGLDKKKMENLLKEHNFRKISFYGGKFLGPLFREPFKPLESEWLIVVAKR